MKKLPIIYAIVAAVCCAINVPAAKILFEHLSPMLTASLYYFGAGLGMCLVSLFQSKQVREKEARITKREWPWLALIVTLDSAASICLMLGLALTNSATAALLGNFELVVTATVALLFFKEAIGRRTWLAVALISLSSILLSVEDFSDIKLSVGAGLVLLSCLCWGINNSCARVVSHKNPYQVTMIKSLGVGVSVLIVAAVTGHVWGNALYIVIALLIGSVCYGLSCVFYLLAQRGMGAARTGIFFSVSPFVGAGLSLVIFWEKPTLFFVIAFIVMAAGAFLAAFERHGHTHTHPEMEHEHRHRHDDGHHDHPHDPPAGGEHSHMHRHEAMTHSHVHAPDIHHNHTHD